MEVRNIVHTMKRRKANWIGHILRRNCLMTRGRGRRRKQLLDHFKEKRGKWKLKEEALDRLLRKIFLEDAVDLLQDDMRNYVCWSSLRNSYCGHIGVVDGREFETQICREFIRIKPTSTYENVWFFYVIIVVNLLHASVTFCGLLQGGVFMKDMLQRQPNQCTDIQY